MVDYCTIDNLIVGASLLITLLIGWYSGRNVKTIRGYAIGTKGYGTLALLLTHLATNIAGASVVSAADKIYTRVSFIHFLYLVYG